jgi:hypothetical protein
LKCRALLSANIPLKKHLTNPAVLLIYVWQDIRVYMGEVSMRNHHINNVASYCCWLLAPFFSGFLYQFWMNLIWRLLLAIDMIFWHNLQIKITTETEDILCTMRCGFLLVEGCMVTCLLFNSEDYSCVICWLFTPYLILFKW